MSDLYKKTFTSLMIDQHFPDAPYITFKDFSAQDQIKRCLKAGVDSIHITTKCHWGHSYFDTEIGIKHPALGSRDMVNELLTECKKHNIEAIAYYCILFENLAARTHSDWCFRDRDGKNVVFQDNWRWDMPCINTGYRKYCVDHINEITGRFEFDTLFLDIFFIPYWAWDKTVCYCDSCKEKYEKNGIDPYSGDPLKRFAVLKFVAQNWAGFLKEVKSTARKNIPGIALSVNGGPFWESGEVIKQLDWIYCEGGESAFNAAAIRGCGDLSPQCGIAAGNDAFDAWPASIVQLQTSRVLAHGNRTFFYFLQGRQGNGIFDESKYNFIRSINKETKKIQPYVYGAKPLKAAGIMHSEASWLWNTADEKQNGINRYGEEFGKIIDVFRELSIPSELVPDWDLSEKLLSEFQLLVISEKTCLDKSRSILLKNYVKNGGNLLVSGTTGLRDESTGQLYEDFSLKDIIGVSFKGINRDYEINGLGGFMRFTDHPLFESFRKTDYMLGKNFVQVECTEAEQAALIAEPFAAETKDSYIGWFALPPGDKADWPAVTINRYGKGTAIYCAASLGNLLEDGVRWPGQFIKAVTEYINLDFGITKTGPATVEAVYFKKDKSLIVHLINNSVEKLGGEVIPVSDVKLIFNEKSFKYNYVSQVYPVKDDLPTGMTEKHYEVKLPPVGIHSIIELR